MRILLLLIGAVLAFPASAESLSPPRMTGATTSPSVGVARTTLAAGTTTVQMEVLQDVQVTQIGTYQDWASHFVWFSRVGSQCALEAQPTHSFATDKPGGVALHAALMTALMNQRRVDVRVSGCRVYEIYLR
jgi:hypothetical protein